MTRRLRNDAFTRSQPGGVAASSTWQRGPSLVVFLLLSLALLALSRLDHSLVRGARVVLSEAAGAVLRVVMVPFAPVQSAVKSVAGLMDVQRDLDTMRDENQRLKGWEARAKELERRMTQLETLANVIPEPGLTFQTARVVADSAGPFVRVALLDAGRDQGLKNGFPVINVDGLVGRLVATGRKSSRLLLLSDLNSRVPVYIGQKSVRALMLGDNGPNPKLAHMPADAKIEAGDDVFTSGVGGVFPRGLRIGVVVDTGEQLRVELNARLDQLEYVSVLFFDRPGSDMAEDEPAVPRAATSGRRAVAGRAGELGSNAP